MLSHVLYSGIVSASLCSPPLFGRSAPNRQSEVICFFSNGQAVPWKLEFKSSFPFFHLAKVVNKDE